MESQCRAMMVATSRSYLAILPSRVVHVLHEKLLRKDAAAGIDSNSVALTLPSPQLRDNVVK